ncbi:hypothetical protein WA588_000713 [Blastocystis sp. NMH]
MQVQSVNLEQTYHELETHYYEMKESLRAEMEEKEQLRHELSQERQQKNELSEQLEAVQKEQSGSGDVTNQLRLEIQQLKEEALLAKELSESRQTQVDVLHTQLQEVNAKLEAAATREFALQSELGQSEGALSAMKIQLTASTQHREVAVSQAQTVSATLKEVQRALDTERASSAEKASRLSHDLAVATAACHAAEASVAQQQQQLRDLTDRLAATQQDLETATRAVVDEKARSQLLAQEHARLESLKDEQIAADEKQRAALQTALAALREKEQAGVSERAQLLRKLDVLQSKLAGAERRLAEAKAHRLSLREEIGLSLDSVKVSEATVAAALEKHHVGVADLYTRMLKLEALCEKTQQEKEEMELYLEHVLQEIEEKTPQLARQQQEYQQMVDGQQRLAKLYTSVSSELAALKHRLEVTQQEAARESKRAEAFEKVAEERKTQLAEVLKKQANGTPVALEELQSANERLLHRIAELETTPSKDASSHGNEALEQELEATRRALAEQERLASTIGKQRDMYKTLLAEKDAALLSKTPSDVLQATQAQLARQLKEATTTLESTRTDLRSQIDTLKRQLVEKEAEAERARQALGVEKGCVRQAHEALERQQSLVATLEERAQQMETEAAHLQDSLVAKQGELDKERKKADDYCERLSAAQESLKASREAWQEERQRLADLLTEVQQGSQAVQQRHEAEIVALRSDIEKACAGQREAEEQLSKARAAQLGRLQEAFEKERSLSEQLKQSQAALREARAALVARERLQKEQSTRTVQEEKTVQSLEERVNAQLAALAQGSTQTLSVSLDDLRNVERQLAKLTAELTATRAELAETAQKAAESQDAAVAMEAELRRFKEEKEKEKASLKQQIAEAEAERSKLVASLNSTSSAAEASKEAELRETLAARETSLAMAQREMEELRRSLEVQREAASTMEANYRQEFQKHSNDLREWREKEKSLQALRTELSTAREVLAKKQGELDAQTAGDGERLKVGVWRVSDVQAAQTEAAELRQKLETLRQQNDSLFKQVAELSRGGPTSGETSESERVATLRRQCEISKAAQILAESRLGYAEKEKAEAEAARVAAEKKADEATAQLEKFQAAGDISSLVEREAESHRLLQVYADSNSTLRAQAAKQAEDLTKTEELVEELEKQAAEARGKREALEKEVSGLREEKSAAARDATAAKAKVGELETKLREVEAQLVKQSAQLAKQAAQSVAQVAQPAQLSVQAVKQVPQPVQVMKQVPQPVQVMKQVPQPVQVMKQVPQPVQVMKQVPQPVQVMKQVTQPVKPNAQPVMQVTQPAKQTTQPAAQSIQMANKVLQPAAQLTKQALQGVAQPVKQAPKPATQPATQPTTKPTQPTPKPAQPPKLNPDAAPFAQSRLFQGVLQTTESLKRPVPEQSTQAGDVKKVHVATEMPKTEEPERVERFMQPKSADAQTPLTREVFFLRMRYLKHLRPENTRIDKLIENYQRKKKKRQVR